MRFSNPQRPEGVKVALKSACGDQPPQTMALRITGPDVSPKGCATVQRCLQTLLPYDVVDGRGQLSKVSLYNTRQHGDTCFL